MKAMKMLWHNIIGHPCMGWCQFLADVFGYFRCKRVSVGFGFAGEWFHQITEPK